MKKTVSLFLILCVIFSFLSACSGAFDDDNYTVFKPEGENLLFTEIISDGKTEAENGLVANLPITLVKQ